MTVILSQRHRQVSAVLLEAPGSLGSPRASLLFGSSGINPVGTHLQILHPISLSDGNLQPSGRTWISLQLKAASLEKARVLGSETSHIARSG